MPGDEVRLNTRKKKPPTLERELPRYLTEKEVAEMTGLSLSNLRNARFQGRGLPYVKVGRSVRYSLTDVIDYMESRKVVPYEND